MCTFNDELPLSQLSPIPSEAEVSNDEELGPITPPTHDELGVIAESAATENTKFVSKTLTSNNDTLLSTDESSNTKKELPVATTNKSRPNKTTTVSKKNTSKTETPPIPPSIGGDIENSEIHQTPHMVKLRNVLQ